MRSTAFLGAAAVAAALAACGRPAPEAAPAPAAAAPMAAYPTTPPALGAPEPLRVPAVVERRLANGLRVLVVRQAELPLVDAILAVRTGSEADPADRAGLATLTADLLDEGAGGRDALAIAKQAALLGADLSTSAGWDASTVSLHVPSANLDSALALMADVALRPGLAAEELERLRARRLTGLAQLRDRGPAIADRVFGEVVFGAAHPYGRPLGGTEASTRAITRADVQRFYGTYWRPNNATLIVVGDVEPDDLVARLERRFGAWAPAEVPAVRYASAPTASATRVYVVDKPGAPQTSVRIGAVGVPRRSADFFPLMVMNTALGGSFTSRLNQNLRETRGYTYGAGSRFQMRREAGPFLASAEVTGAKTDSSVLEFFRELRAIRDTIPAAELAKTKSFLQLQLPNAFETTGDIASQLLAIALYDLPLDYFDAYGERIGAVSQADVQRVARRWVQPDSLVVVLVGDRASIEPALRAAGVGEVEVRPFTGGE